MLNYELKKLFTKRLNRAFLLAAALLAIAFSFFAVRSVIYFDENGTMDKSLGAVRLLTEEKNKWSGDLTPKVIAGAVAETQQVDRSYPGDVPNRVYYEVLQPASDIVEMAGDTIIGYDKAEDPAAQITEKQAKAFYKIRREKLCQAAREYGKTPQQQDYLKAQYEQVDTPFAYEAADPWKIAIRYGSFYGMALVLLIGFLAADLFADEFRQRADSIFFASRYGRTKAARSKIGAGLVMASIVYFAAMLLFSILMFAIMGTSGAGTPIQMEWKDSIYAFTYGEVYGIVLLCGYIASLFSASTTMLLSSQKHAYAVAICVPFLLFCVSPFIARAVGAETFSDLIPQQLFYVDYMIREPVTFQIGSTVLGHIPFVMVLYLVVALVFLPLIYCKYHRYAIK